jgi:ABC-type sugar transport system permease subunit
MHQVKGCNLLIPGVLALLVLTVYSIYTCIVCSFFPPRLIILKIRVRVITKNIC